MLHQKLFTCGFSEKERKLSRHNSCTLVTRNFIIQKETKLLSENLYVPACISNMQLVIGFFNKFIIVIILTRS